MKNKIINPYTSTYVFMLFGLIVTNLPAQPPTRDALWKAKAKVLLSEDPRHLVYLTELKTLAEKYPDAAYATIVDEMHKRMDIYDTQHQLIQFRKEKKEVSFGVGANIKKFGVDFGFGLSIPIPLFDYKTDKSPRQSAELYLGHMHLRTFMRNAHENRDATIDWAYYNYMRNQSVESAKYPGGSANEYENISTTYLAAIGLPSNITYDDLLKELPQAQKDYLTDIGDKIAANNSDKSEKSKTALTQSGKRAADQIKKGNEELRMNLDPLLIEQSTNQDAFKAALEKANNLNDVRTAEVGVHAAKSALFLLNEFAKISNSKEFREIAAPVTIAGTGVIGIAESVIQFKKLELENIGTLANALGTVALTANVTGIVLNVFQEFNNKKNASDATILQQHLAIIQEQITNLHKNMSQRFDIVDTKLNRIYEDLISEFGKINSKLEYLKEDTETIIKKLNEIESELYRIEGKLSDQIAGVSEQLHSKDACEYWTINRNYDEEISEGEFVRCLTEHINFSLSTSLKSVWLYKHEDIQTQNFENILQSRDKIFKNLRLLTQHPLGFI